MELVRDTFHRGRKINAVVDDSLCSYPEIIGGHNWYGFRCWQRRRSDGLYRRIQSVRVQYGSYGRWSSRYTMLGAWVERFPQRQELQAA
jgi:hypothetical protein